MIFDYSATKTFAQSIDVVDPGNTGFVCYSTEGTAYYLAIKSIMGRLNFFEFGPVIEGVDSFLETFTFQYKSIKYSEKALVREIKSYLNDPMKHISDVEEVTAEDIILKFPDIQTCWNNI